MCFIPTYIIVFIVQDAKVAGDLWQIPETVRYNASALIKLGDYKIQEIALFPSSFLAERSVCNFGSSIC